MLDQTFLDFNSAPTPLISGNLLDGDVTRGGMAPQASTASALNVMDSDETLLAQWENLDADGDLWPREVLIADTTTQFSPQALDPKVTASPSARMDDLTGGVSGVFSASGDGLTAQTSNGARHLRGSLRADRFSVDLNARLTVISGNGNIDYGRGGYDYLDLSNLSSSSVASWSPAESNGVLFDPGNGTRVFDSLWLTNGSQILFEGLDAVQFSDSFLDLSVDPNDPKFGQQWNLHMMGVQNAWRFTQGNSQILVGVQDTGLGYNTASQSFHPDLGKILHFPDNVADDFLRSVQSHGTSVQSIINAASNNGYGMSGINWHSSVFNIDVLYGNGDLSTFEATQRMINEANSKGQRLVINMSFRSDRIDPALESLIANNQQNALFVVSAGNDDRNGLDHPAMLGQRYKNVIAVGASWGTQDRDGRPTNPGDRISYPDDWGSNYGPGLSLMGPSEVIAASATSSDTGVQFDFTSKFNGTSAAAPNVAGVASLVWSINPQLSATQVHQILADTAYDLGSAGHDLVTGSGFVNADAAVRRAMAISRSFNGATLT